MTDQPKLTHALEDYLKAIYQLSEEAPPVIAARIAAETGVSASTMFATLRRLAKEGYVTINGRLADGRTIGSAAVLTLQGFVTLANLRATYNP